MNYLGSLGYEPFRFINMGSKYTVLHRYYFTLIMYTIVASVNIAFSSCLLLKYNSIIFLLYTNNLSPITYNIVK